MSENRIDISWVLSPAGRDKAAVMLLSSDQIGALSVELLALVVGETCCISADHPARGYLKRNGLLNTGALARDPIVWAERERDAVIVHVQPDGGFRQSMTEGCLEERIFPGMLYWLPGFDCLEYRCERDRKFIAATIKGVKDSVLDEWELSLAPSLEHGCKIESWKRCCSEEIAKQEVATLLSLRAVARRSFAALVPIEIGSAKIDFDALAKARKALLG